MKGSSTDGKKASEMLKQPLGTDFKIGVGGHRKLPSGPQPVVFVVACRRHHGSRVHGSGAADDPLSHNI